MCSGIGSVAMYRASFIHRTRSGYPQLKCSEVWPDVILSFSDRITGGLLEAP